MRVVDRKVDPNSHPQRFPPQGRQPDLPFPIPGTLFLVLQQLHVVPRRIAIFAP
jgi:hypothetical protein